MARKQKSISIYEQIENVQNEIISTEQCLAQLKSQLENLLAEKDELEMRQTWTAIKESGLTMEDIQKLLEKHK
jgi:regulator of replication initiation timing